MSDFYFTNLNDLLGFEHSASSFNSVSEPLYDKENYLEAIFFAYLDLTLRFNSSKRFTQFISNFDLRLNHLKPYFKENPEKFKSLVENYYENFAKMQDRLKKNLENYKNITFSNESDATKMDILKDCREDSSRSFRFIMKLLIVSIWYEEEEEESKNLIRRFLRNDNSIEVSLMNKTIARALKVNIRIYFDDMNHKSKNYYYDEEKKKVKDPSFDLNLLIDKIGCVRILYKETKFSYDQKITLQKNFELEKNELTKELRKEIKDYRKLKDMIYECYNNIFKNYIDYVGAILRKENIDDIKTAKLFLKKEMKDYKQKILSKEKDMKEKYEMEITGKEKFQELDEYMKSLKSDLQEVATKASEGNMQDLTEGKNPEFKDNRKICDKCNQKKAEEFIEFNCLCQICETCFKEHLDNLYEIKAGVTDIPCCNPKCSDPNLKMRDIKCPKSMELLEKYLGKEKVEEIRKIKNNRLNISLKKYKCPVCGEMFIIDEFVTFDCDHRLCEGCCIGYIKEVVKNKMNGFEIPCFEQNCNAPASRKGLKNGIYVFKRLLGEEECSKIEMAYANQQAKYNCSNPACRLPFDLDVDPNDEKNNFFICDECRTETCLKCKKNRHKGKECAKIDEETRAHLKETKQMIRICPNPVCLQPVTKDENCDHVQCPYCKLDYCFPCSMTRSPTIEHGNEYHRRDCKNFRAWLDKEGKEVFDDKFEKKCTECLRLGKLCERPKQTTKEFYAEKKLLEYLEVFAEQEEEKI